jgi:hypothetical protein
MPKILAIILLILSLWGCHKKTEKSNGLVERFEKILGEQETAYLNEIVGDFDKYLASKYPDNQSKFKTYLVEISESKVNEYWEIDKTKLKKYQESNLFGKYDTIFPDSVWFKKKLSILNTLKMNLLEKEFLLKEKTRS